MIYEDIAPILQKTGLTKSAAETFVANKKVKEVKEKVEEDVTKEQAEIICGIFRDGTIEEENGFVGIAQRLGIKTSEVKAIFNELRKIEVELNSVEINE